MKILSLYCGGGGIDEGLKQAGLFTSLAIDLDTDSCKTMKLNHNTEVINGKIEDYINSLDNYDLIVGGPPCPNFSNANTKRNYDLTEVNNFWRIIERIKPKNWIMENVPNIIKVFKKEPNYLLDCSNFNVPQKRIRRFYTNFKEPQKTGIKGVSDFLNYTGYVSNSGFSKCNQHIISRKITMPCKTLQIASTLRITDKRVYSKKYPQYPQDYKVTHIFSNKELQILQGFPINYKFYGNKQSIKRQICNAVPPPVIKEIVSIHQDEI